MSLEHRCECGQIQYDTETQTYYLGVPIQFKNSRGYCSNCGDEVITVDFYERFAFKALPGGKEIEKGHDER